MTRLAALVLFASSLVACGSNDGALPADVPAPVEDKTSREAGAPGFDAGKVVDSGAPAPSGTAFSVLTYNVAGLPEGLSSSKPATNTKLISPKLNAFDLVMVQEDFAYHADLASLATHAYRSTPKGASGADLGDGVNVFSALRYTQTARVKWNDCNGIVDDKNDCLTSKGFLVGALELAPGVVIDVYDMHADAGRASGDAKARTKQVAQLVAEIAARSAGKAVLVAGDTNMKTEDEPAVLALLSGAGLTDACRAVACPEPGRIDRVMFRGSADFALIAKSWAVETTFVDAKGDPLSDHEPVRVGMEWRR